MGRYQYWVVDGDGHVAEPESLWARFLEPKYAMTPWTVKVLAERSDLSDEAKRKILGENAKRFYDLD